MNTRIKALDVAKGIGILFVIFAHLYQSDSLYIIVYSFHMPLFYIISGITFRPDRYDSVWKLIASRKRTVGKYLFYCLLAVLLHGALYLYRTDFSGLVKLLKEAAISIVWAPYSLKYFSSFNSSMWFIPSLILVQVLFYEVNRISNGKVKTAVIVLISTVGALTTPSFAGIDFSFLPFNFTGTCFALGFFAFGVFLSDLIRKQILEAQLNTKRKAGLVFLFAVCTILMVYLARINGHVSIGSRILNNSFIFYITGICGSIAVLVFSRFVSNCRFLNFCGVNSLALMGLHLIAYWMASVTVLKEGIIPFPSRKIRQIVSFILVSFLCVVFLYIHNGILKKQKCRKMISESKKER